MEPPTTQIADENWPCAFLFRGNAVDGVNQYKPLPKYVAGEHMAFEGCEDWV